MPKFTRFTSVQWKPITKTRLTHCWGFHEATLLTRARMGHSQTLPADGGGRFAPSPAFCQTTGSILDPKTAFDGWAPGLNFPNTLQNFI